MRRGDLVRLKPSTAHRFARRTGVVLKVSPSNGGAVATVLLDPTQAYPAVNHFLPVTEEALEVIGRAVRLTSEQLAALIGALQAAWEDAPPSAIESNGELQDLLALLRADG